MAVIEYDEYKQKLQALEPTLRELEKALGIPKDRQELKNLQAETEQAPMEPEDIEALRRQIKEELLAQRESMLAEIEDQMQQGDENEGQPEQVHKERGEGKDTGAVGGAED